MAGVGTADHLWPSLIPRLLLPSLGMRFGTFSFQIRIVTSVHGWCTLRRGGWCSLPKQGVALFYVFSMFIYEKNAPDLYWQCKLGYARIVLEAQWLHLTRSSLVANTVLSLQYTHVMMKALVCNALRLTIWLIIRKICCICTVSMCSNQHVRLSASNTQCHLSQTFIAIKV